jgi:aminoglycoside phosphotransferase (APT) family kinase protein
LLRHLEAEGFAGAPRVIGSGFDQRGREVLSYIDGEFVHPRPWNEGALPHLGRLLREMHRAAQSFTPAPKAVWRDWHGRRLGNAKDGFGHCDTGPWNVVARDSLPHALIDWEVSGPVDPIYELAQTCWMNAQLHDDDVAELQGLSPLVDRARHVRLILDGYEMPSAERVGFVDKMIEFAVHDAAGEAIQASVTPDTSNPAALWGITWRTRSAAWMLRHRSTLQSAL